MTGEKKRTWEKENIREARENSKTLWNLVNDLLGKTKSKEDEIYLYREDGTKHRVEDIYQKIPRISLKFWYGKDGTIVKKE